LIAAHYLDGVQYDELAEALHLPLGTIKTQLHRAKRQLRRLLETELK
jgi:DNA-directed RNA polymerase specialized sigma24 family protein